MQAEISDLKGAVPDAMAASSRWAQYHALTKPKVVQLIVFCAFIGMVLAVPMKAQKTMSCTTLGLVSA